MSGLAELPVPENQLRIVVGFDGSDAGTKALEWTVAEARRQPASVDVVTAWTFPMVEGYAVTHPVAEIEERARETVKEAMSYVTREAPEVVVRGETTDGLAGPALVDAAKGADLLVVGARGVGGIERLLLGSVSAYCAQHATCPVVIVR